jgi:hypothetical protein
LTPTQSSWLAGLAEILRGLADAIDERVIGRAAAKAHAAYVADPTTPATVLTQIVKLALPDRLKQAVWVVLKTGRPDVGVTVEAFRAGRVSGEVLIGRVTYGAALGYDVWSKDNVAVSVIGGAAHDWFEDVRRGWSPVVGASIKF